MSFCSAPPRPERSIPHFSACATDIARRTGAGGFNVIDGLTDPDILGVEAPLWGETGRSADDIDALAFPRIAAAAEAAWSPPFGTSALRTWESFRTRVGGLGPLWERLGIRFTALPEIAWLADAHAGDGAASSDESDADEIDAADSERP